MKRVLCGFLSVVLLVGCLCSAAWADTTENTEEDPSFVELAESLLTRFGFTENTSDYNRAESIYGYIVDEIAYASDSLNSSPLAVLNERTGNAQGIASLYQGLLAQAGVQAEVIHGTVQGEGHSWVLVELKNAVSEGGAVYYHADPSLEQGSEEYSFFLICSDSMAEYVPDASFATEEFLLEHPLAKADFDRDCWESHYYWGGTFTWKEDCSSVEAATKCVLCKDLYTDSCQVTKTVLREPTHTDEGLTRYVAVLSIDGVTITTSSKEITVEKTAQHTLGSPRWSWIPSGNGYSASAVFSCTANDGYSEEYTGEVTSAEETGSCTVPGSVTYTASVTVNGTTWSDTKRVEGEVLPHNYESTVTEPTCTTPGQTTHVCTICQNTYSDGERDALGHSVPEYNVTIEPTAEQSGEKSGICSRCGVTVTVTIPALDGSVPGDNEDPPVETETPDSELPPAETEPAETETPEGHQHDYAVEIREPSCTQPGGTYYLCGCGDSYAEDTSEPLGHSFTDFRLTASPTCTSPGELTGYCSRCGTTAAEAIRALGHSYQVTVVAPTCREQGFTAHVCATCGYEMRDAFTSPADHSYDNGVVTREPAGAIPGEKIYTCLVCGHTRTETILAQKNPFVDVAQGEYFFQPVLWAYQNGITSGVDSSHFAPGSTCTRGQVVTFLWRTMGSPEPKSQLCPFVDVSPGDYFYKAVLWAYENGITTGIEWNRFVPDGTVNRAQVVTFLYRTEQGSASGMTNPFVDVFKVDYYYNAVLWAYEQGITSGMDDTHFAPGGACTRGQVVTFLYRASKHHS